MRKLRIKFKDRPALIIHRAAFANNHLVYIGRANRAFRYPWGRSRIGYIGTTRKGARRVASSAAWKGEELLFARGVTEVEFCILTCAKHPGVRTWIKLERALIIRFREKYGAVPVGNISGKKMRWKDEARYFRLRRLDQLIEKLG
jgi:hypothetical protein